MTRQPRGYVAGVSATIPEVEHARSAGLRYVDDTMPGITRKKVRSGFAFFSPDGKRITDDDGLRRIKSIGVPPAYEHVWICPLPNGHLQATARDAKGRKQYRYHKRWREVRDENKYVSTIAFGEALPTLRARVEKDLKRECMSREKVIATVVRMLDDTLIRVGNETYARDNGSYGLTTLRPRHVRVIGEKRIRLRFRGKSGVEHAITIDDKRLAKTIARCRHLPGELLFSFLDDEGHVHPVQSDDVNDYLRDTMGSDFSAKDFRTFAASVICATELEKAGVAGSVADAKHNVTAAVTVTAKRLGNTPTVCRKSYVHPAVIETYLDELKLDLSPVRAAGEARGLDDDERRVLKFLTELGERDIERQRLARLERSLKAAQTKRRRTRQAA
ncbi:MAG: DNA topoisomerase IB [Candidatus Eremiobacteraeota bacterium]|nr:DNA topoisomerase IB [Candidatus Eremiobacteraeota bacterium]MBC5803549.1 DNA topoisomerase IB [Candidatus Eremiobacteraeota bacterium]MBC5820410.1 DNA topoisomerase IB [Candidatus Eremiobacteraeota bacterium]